MSVSPRPLGVSVRTKLTILLVGTAFVALMLACASFVYYDRTTYAHARRETLSVLVKSVAQSAYGPTAFQDPDSAAVILRVLDAEPSAMTGAIYTKSGEMLTSWTRSGGTITLPKDLRTPDHVDQSAHFLLGSSIANAEGEAGTLRVVFSTRDIQARTRQFLQIAAAVLFGSVMLALALGAMASAFLTRPVRILSQAARRVQERMDFDVRAERVSNDELGALTDAFNAMLSMLLVRDRELTHHRAHLEVLVAERTRDLDRRTGEMRLVLDNVDQGFVMLDRLGAIGGQRSASFDSFFGTPSEGSDFSDHLDLTSPGFGASFRLGWSAVIEAYLPLEVTLNQLPAMLVTTNGRSYELAYRPIGQTADDSFDRLLVVLTDVTVRLEKERREAEQAQLLAALEQIGTDRVGFVDFCSEADALVVRITEDRVADPAVIARDLHTLKGNCGLYGLSSLVSLIHAIETECIETGEPPTQESRAQLHAAWMAFANKTQALLGETAGSLTIDRHEWSALLEAIRNRVPPHELLARTERLAHAPVGPRLARLGAQAKRLATRLGKPHVDVQVDAQGVRASADSNWLWQVLPHVVSNSVDHGIDSVDERMARGKDSAARLRIVAREMQSKLVVEIEDDGRGIDWHAVADKAQALGITVRDKNDLERALFAERLSTRMEATEVSGRGIGLAAVMAACEEHGAQIEVTSDDGRGTLFRISLPNTQSRRSRETDVPVSWQPSIRPARPSLPA